MCKLLLVFLFYTLFGVGIEMQSNTSKTIWFYETAFLIMKFFYEIKLNNIKHILIDLF